MGGGSAAPRAGPAVGVSSTLISGRRKAGSQSPYSWTLQAGAANREKKLFPRWPRKVGSCLLMEDHIKNAGLQMFFLRRTEAGGWMQKKKKKILIPSGDDLYKKLPPRPHVGFGRKILQKDGGSISIVKGDVLSMGCWKEASF